MHSPRIAKRLIGRIRRVARAAGVSMTIWVSNALEGARERAERTASPNGHMNHTDMRTQARRKGATE